MILTEKEAVEKACCKNNPPRSDGKVMAVACLASQCMAWRWHSYPTGPDPTGFCGLAGDPGISSELEDIATQLRHVCP